jgi:Asp-tRNA(Asn)/Glu-tRNA(Gln) amidotransferase A subunit family amidase
VLLQDPLIEKLQKPTTAARVAALAEQLGAAGLTLHRASAGAGFAEMIARHRRVMLAELGRTHGGLPRDRIATAIADGIAEGLAIPDEEYHAALRDLAGFRARFWAGFAPDDFIMVPAAPDVAPEAGSTGDPSFVIPTTVLGGPVVTLRAGLAADTGMPVGALLFARPGADAAMASFLFSATATALDL